MHTLPFDTTFLQDAAKLLKQAHHAAYKSFGESTLLTREQCCELILHELQQDVCKAVMLFEGNRLIGFAIGLIKENDMWGNSGWVNSVGWAVHPEFNDGIGLLYKAVAEAWVARRVYQHYFLVYAAQKLFLERFYELGFAKEQTHAMQDVTKLHIPEQEYSEVPGIQIRPAKSKDSSKLASFARLIAEYQIQAPCFASAPESYLESLDEGYANLTKDPEAEVLVVEKDGELVGYQVYFHTDSLPIQVPKNSVELAVSGISSEYRGIGLGTRLTKHALRQQQVKGIQYVLTDWRCANLAASKFWPSMGFSPIAFRLVRHLEPSHLRK